MDVKLHSEIIRDIKSINSLNVNDTFYNIISKKYPSVPEETLRSIISLWFQRKVTQNSWRIKEIKIYDLYQKFIAAGTQDACLQIAHQLDYPPSLIAKIVLTSYLAEVKSRKIQVNAVELKNMRKQLCPHCKSLWNNSAIAEASIIEDTSSEHPSIKKHLDPRVELALNLFGDDDDEVGKYFLEKFTFSNNKAKKHNIIDEKQNKFFWQASTFEEIGEKNVKKYANVEKLFNDRLHGVDFAARFSGRAEKKDISELLSDCDLQSENIESNVISSISSIKITDASVPIECGEKNDLQIDHSTFPSHDCNNSTKSIPLNDTNSTADEFLNDSREEAEMKICTCSSVTISDNSDSDSESDEAYENFSVKELFENPSLIENPVLARDVFYCISFDDQYGPTSDVLCSSSGITHEKLLEECVKNVGLAYKTEDKLRGDGFDKTPDIILLVPVAVNNFVINWVESKALFADCRLHQDFEKKQFRNYINRFGPGLVIYWHGYVNDILKSDLVNKQIIISNRFPPKESFTFVKSDKFRSWMKLEGCPEA